MEKMEKVRAVRAVEQMRSNSRDATTPKAFGCGMRVRGTTRLRRLILLFGLASILIAFISCAGPPSPPSQLVLFVSNELGRSVAEIHKKACDDLDLSFEPIEGSRLAAGERRGLVLPSTCVDLIAYDSRGHIVGEQRGLEMLPDAKWVLRK